MTNEVDDLELYKCIQKSVKTVYGPIYIHNQLQYNDINDDIRILKDSLLYIQDWHKDTQTRNTVISLLKEADTYKSSIDWFYEEKSKDFAERIKHHIFDKPFELLNTQFVLNSLCYYKIFMPVMSLGLFSVQYAIPYYYANISLMQTVKINYQTQYSFCKGLLILVTFNKKYWQHLVDVGAHIMVISIIALQMHSLFMSAKDCYDNVTLYEEFFFHNKNIYRFMDIAHTIKLIDYNLHKDLVVKRENMINTWGNSIWQYLNRGECEKSIRQAEIYLGKIDFMINSRDLILQDDWGYPEFAVNDNPYIQINGMFHPMINHQFRVKNNLTMQSNLIITGPNAAGKSTFMKNIGVCVYLSQVFLISPCTSIILTPFTKIFTYMNIVDQINKESLFEAEINRCFSHYRLMEQTYKNKFVLTLFDELFTGTNYKEGLRGSRHVCNLFSNFNTSLFCLTTHYTKLSKLEKKFPTKFMNYKMEANVKKNKNNIDIQFPYIITRGVSQQFIAIDLLKQKGLWLDSTHV